MATFNGTSGDDVYVGGADNDQIRGGDGADQLSGAGGADTIDGEAGTDTVWGGAGADQLSGGAGDRLFGEDGDDTLFANQTGPGGAMTMDGGAGADWFYVSNTVGQTAIGYGGDGEDTFTIGGVGTFNLDGGAGSDTFLFDAYRIANGIEGTVTLGAGQDRLMLGYNTYAPPKIVVTDFTPGPLGDRIDLSGYLSRFPATNANPFDAGMVRVVQDGSAVVQVNFNGEWRPVFILQGVSAGQLTAANFEGWPPNGGGRTGLELVGDAGDNEIYGTSGADTISGDAGADAINGSVGDNLISGGDGADTLSVGFLGISTVHGGAGDDRLEATNATGGEFYGDGGADTAVISRGDTVQGTLIISLGDGDDSVDYFGKGLASILGGTGDDTLKVGGWEFLTPTEISVDAGSGRDLVTVTGGGHYIVRLGDGADTIAIANTFYTDSDTGRGTQVTVTDFNVFEDRIDPQAARFRFGEMDGETVIQFPGASGALDEWQTVLRLQGVGPLALGAGNFSSGVMPDRWRVGGDGGDLLTAGGGFERLDGGSGDDRLIGSAAANTLRGASGADSLSGLDGADSLDGGRGADTVSGGVGDDTITDYGGANYLRGDEGADTISGGYEFDDINGNMGNDTAHGNDGDDWVVGGKDNDLLFGDFGGDIVYGNLGEDTCDGGIGADLIRGGQGNDTISGGAGTDWLSGDRGDDTISGGSGADTFHTFGDAGIDRVLDFRWAEGDKVQLDPGTQWTVAQVGADTVISMTGGAQMILVGVQMSTLPTGWIFGA